MKKLLFALTLLVSMISHGQTYTIEDKALTGVFEVAGKSKAELFSAINKWISINYNSGKSVTQLSDNEAGIIVVKGINEVSCANNAKILYPNMKAIPDISTTSFNHLIEVNIKDNKFRITYTLVDINLPPNAFSSVQNTKIPDNINLNGTPESALMINKELMDSTLKKALIGKEKRDKYIESIKPMYDELNSNILNDMKATMLSIQSAVTSTTKDGW
jgi:hypothetical protein